jgi:hypothetical protein
MNKNNRPTITEIVNKADEAVKVLIAQRGYDGCEECKGNNKNCDCNYCYHCYGVDWWYDFGGCDN